MKRTTEVTKKNNALIKAYTPQAIPGLSKLILKLINTVLVPSTLPPRINIDLFSPRRIEIHAISLFFLEKKSRPSWSGYMTDSSHGDYPGKSTVFFLPIIDMDPTDLSCIYSTIAFIINQANSLEIQTPVIAFDQPLWLKANEIVQTKELNVVLMLGGFPMMMSFMGSIGHLMEGSGLPEALHNVYAKNSVENMMTGKAVSKDVRGHF